MPRFAVPALLSLCLLFPAASSYSQAAPPTPPVSESGYPGIIQLAVDATDLSRRLYRVRETIPVRSGPLTLWYPQWIPGNHAPTGPINQFAGLLITGNGQRIGWTRDPLDMYAFQLEVPAGVEAIEIEFQSLSPTSADQGRVAMTTELMSVQWSRLLLYPAGYDARKVRFQPSLRLPTGWQFGTALEQAGSGQAGSEQARSEQDVHTFQPLALVDLVDSPVYAGRHFRRFDLDPGARVPVHLNVVADAPELLDAKPAILDAHRALVKQADRVFGPRPFAHYDFLLALSDQFSGIGLEHRQSSENGTFPGYLTGTAPFGDNYLLAHEYAHSWNGKAVRPATLWTPHFNTPMQNGLLWVYEGQTEFWAWVLAARAGLYTPEQARDVLAANAAMSAHRAGRGWRSLQDTVHQGIVDFNDAPQAWESWQRGYDFYDEGTLLWLDVDTRLRELSGGRRSLDDFARRFFGGRSAQAEVVRYGVDDVVKTLQAVQPHDWAAYLRARVDSHGPDAPLQGLARAGWKLVYTDQPNLALADAEGEGDYHDFRYSLGMQVASDSGTVREVLWDSPAYRAGVARDMQLVAVAGMAYNAERLVRVLQAARKDPEAVIELLVKQGDAFRTLRIDYHGGVRHPHLQRIAGTPDRLGLLHRPVK